MRRVAAKGLICACAALAIVSCASVPERAPSEWLGALPEGATLYASFAVKGSADLLKKQLATAGADLKDVASLVDMTNRLVCSVTMARGEKTKFSVVALGGYPSGFIGMRLAGSKDWKKQSGPAGDYWQWNKAGIQMGLPMDGILLAANGDVESLLARWKAPRLVPVPPEVAADMKTADLVVYLPELPGGIQESAARQGRRIPIQDVWLEAVKVKGGYDVSGTANTGSEQESKLLTLVLRLGLVAWLRTENVPNAAERLKTIRVESSGVQVKLTGLHLSDQEVVPLFLSLVKGMSPAEPSPSEPGADGAPGASDTSPADGTAPAGDTAPAGASAE